MFARTLFFALLLAAPAGAVPDADPVVVTLRPAVSVSEPNILMKTVASVEGGSQALRERIAGLDLVELTSRTRVLVSRQQVACRIQIAGIEPRLFRIVGAPESVVTLVGPRLTEEALFAAARERVLQQFPHPESVTVRPMGPVWVPTLELAVGDQLRVAAEPLTTGKATGVVRVEVGVYVNGDRRRTVTVPLDVKQQQSVAVAKVLIERGTILKDEMVQVEQRSVAEGETPPAAPGSIAGKRAARAILPGQAVMTADLEGAEEVVLVHPHEAVRLVARVGAMQVLAVGEALQEGRSGQSIRVRNVDSGRIVTGRVVEHAVVEVDY